MKINSSKKRRKKHTHFLVCSGRLAAREAVFKAIVGPSARLHINRESVRDDHDGRRQMKAGVVVWLEGGWCFDR